MVEAQRDAPRPRSAATCRPQPDSGLSGRDDLITITVRHPEPRTDERHHRAPPGTGLAVALLCTLAALTGCAGGYGLAMVTGGIEEAGR